MKTQEEWDKWLTLSRYSNNTKDIYNLYKEKMDNITGNRSPTQDDIDEFLLSFIEVNKADNVARAFLKHYIEQNNLNLVIPKTRGRKPSRKTMYYSSELVYSFANRFSPRDNIIIRLMFEGGLRVSEVIHLRKKDINIANRTANGIGKGNKEFNIRLTDETTSLIEKYAKVYSPDDFIFGITRQRVWQIISKYCENNNLEHIHPHSFRHSCGADMKKKGFDLIDIQDYLRHTKLETTAIYAHINKDDFNKKWDMMMKR